MDEKVKSVKRNLESRKFIPKESRHIRWNYEPSGSYDMDNELVKYHFVIVDDSDYDRGRIRDDIFDQITEVDSRISDKYESEGKVGQGRFGYKYLRFESIVSPKFLDLSKLSVPSRFDKNLKDRKVLDLEGYIENTYNN